MADAQGRIVLVNREVERLFGYSREELLGQPVEMLVPIRFRAEHPGHLRAFLADPSTRAMGAGRDLFGLRRDGIEVPVEIGLTPVITEEGIHVIGSIVDISARKLAEQEHRQLEARLRQTQKLEALGTLAGGIAHDFNNLLGGIVGCAELIAPQLPAGGQGHHDLAEVLKAAERGRQLVRRILRFSHRQEMERRSIAVAETVQEAVGLLRASLPAGVELRLEVDPRVPRVLGDSTSIQQIVMNLATNGSHAMADGGRLEIRLEPFYAADNFVRTRPGLHEGLHCLLSVRDTGVGMSPEVLQRAFEPFFTTKEPGVGTGLGLALVHAIMRDHRGLVELESEQGRGTTARCYFPALEGDVSDGSSVADSPPRGNGEHVLFVDNEELLAFVGARRLRQLGYRVTEAVSSREALQQFLAAPRDFDLLMTDLTMPGLSGIELATRANAARPGLPVVLLTGFDNEIAPETLRAAGIRSVVTKPVTVEQLAIAAHRALGVGTRR